MSNSTDLKVFRVAEGDDELTAHVEDADGNHYRVKFKKEQRDGGLVYRQIGHGHGVNGDRPHLSMEAARTVAAEYLTRKDDVPVVREPVSGGVGGYGSEATYSVVNHRKRHVFAGRDDTALCGYDHDMNAQPVRGGAAWILDEPELTAGMCGTCRKALEKRANEGDA